MTPYPFSASGEREPEMPACCPFGGDGVECQVGEHCRRERSCGPGHPLVVAKCVPHRKHFTLYPPGWVPYGRVPLVRPRSKGWQKTLFAAAILAGSDELWPEASVAAPACGATQRRRIARCGRWLGLDGSHSQCERAALALHVPLETAVRAHRQFTSTRRRRPRGRAVEQMLGGLGDGPVLWRLLALGVELGVCGVAYRCTDRSVLQPVFRGRNAAS